MADAHSFWHDLNKLLRDDVPGFAQAEDGIEAGLHVIGSAQDAIDAHNTNPLHPPSLDGPAKNTRAAKKSRGGPSGSITRKFAGNPTREVARRRRISIPREPAMSGQNDEVGVVPPPKRLALTAPDYFTVDLPYEIFEVHEELRDAAGTTLRSYRLNSIWDPDASSITTKHPMGRDTWACIYQYYRVLKCRVEITVFNYEDRVQNTTNRDALIAGIEWTDDSGTTGTAQTAEAFMEEKQSMTHVLHGLKMAPANAAYFEYTYTPESWDYHVEQTGVENRWTAVGANPNHTHLLLLRMFPAVSVDTLAMKLEVNARLVYTVQFREPRFDVIQQRDDSISPRS